MKREFESERQGLLISVWRGILVGLMAGALVSAFRWLIAKLFRLFLNAYHLAQSQLAWALILLLLSLLLIYCVGVLVKSEQDIKGSGIPHVEGELMGLLHPNWWSVLWRKFVGGVISISMGLMLGREGPSIQLGAMTAKGIAEKLNLSRREQRILIASGAAAGLSAAFNAPIAGLLFVVEEVYHHFSRHVWITALVASLVANAVSLQVFGQKAVLAMPDDLPIFPLKSYWILIIMGLVMGLLAYLYEWVILRMGILYGHLGRIIHLPPHHYGIIALIFIFPLGLLFPQLLGGGNELIVSLPQSSLVFQIAFAYLIIRFVGSMISYGSGLPGGIFLPLLTLGALAGYTFGLFVSDLSWMHQANLALFLIFGMSAYFGAVSKAPLTAMILVTEMVGNLQQLMPLAVVTLLAYLVMDLLGGEPVYEAMLVKMIPSLSVDTDSQPTIIDLPVTDRFAGRRVSELSLPQDVLIYSQVYQHQTEVVNGQTLLKAGAKLYILVNETEIKTVRRYFLS
ncbi:ClC family H(+)/Cl(-) exchange transporter [Streptococcus loxodontisalivarius]|uniref:H+/Cl- antiporter ClcA n=1 Tax=Streptococcus loxodontisalivarius TaxID=1349415 RepID=A0ABS2PQ60_9STRE|nr:ClC family H(+)/Cl(-) exchange transporter [Streptococcus loxodontisalivarius]MBM7642178.1 H+/Cl- antiporter ClcA [Streptococcus loxodontisalivarius]